MGRVQDRGRAQHLFEFEWGREKAFTRLTLDCGAAFPLSLLFFEAHEELLRVTSYLRARPSPYIAFYCPPILIEQLEALEEELVLLLCPATVLGGLLDAAWIRFFRS